jgi:magnesium transporter
MIEAYGSAGGKLVPLALDADACATRDAVWIDVTDPTPEEERAVEARFGIDVPTPEEMAEIESSSRLYESGGALYMTAVLICGSDTREPSTTAVTFILSRDRLVTVRYATPQSFRIFPQRCRNGMLAVHTHWDALLGLLGTIVDRAADILERVGADLEATSREIFRHTGARARRPAGRERQPQRDLQEIIQDVGHGHDVVFRIRESLASLLRMTAFLRGASNGDAADIGRRIQALEDDLRSLGDYDGYLSNKVDFMLDATLGLVGIQQNAIIKIFSVVAVIFMPPTLVASIYGMNFDHMPELHWLLGYPWALGLMVLAAILPYWFFKIRGWL